MKILAMFSLLFLLTFCGNTPPAPEEILSDQNLSEVVESLPAWMVDGLNELPGSDGALGRNKSGYFHVRFQLSISPNAAFTTYHRSEEALIFLANSIDYSFQRQNPAGDFQVQVPANLQYLGEPVASDLASGVAFFGAALGNALNLMDQSQWFMTLPSPNAAKQSIQMQTSKVQLMANWLGKQQAVLQQIDAGATNRLFWDALAYYGLGVYLEDDAAKKIGEEFLNLALSKQHADGYFLENGGFDSSYNSVSLMQGLQLFVLLPSGDLKTTLNKALWRAAQWQLAHIKSSGEMLLEGNTRVYPGGEKFLGEEKMVAWKDLVQSFYWLSILTTNKKYSETADRVRAFYQ